MPLLNAVRAAGRAIRPRRDPKGPARLVLLTPNLLGRDGVSTVARHMTRALLGADLKGPLQVIALHDAPDEPLPESLAAATVVRCGGSRGRFVLETVRALSSALARSVASPGSVARRGHRPIHVVANHLHVATVVLPAVAAGIVDLSLFLHSLEVWTPQRGARRKTLQVATRLLTNSAHTRERFLRAHPECARVETHVCWLAASDGARPTVDPPRTDRPASAGAPYALIVGRMPRTETHKGHDHLLEAWPAVQAQVPGLRLVVVGRGDDVPRLQDKTRQLGLVEVVSFTGGVTDTELASLLRGCAFYCMPSRDEGFGLVFVEAMAAGKPCIAGTGAPEEIVRHGIDGFIVDPTSKTGPADLVAHITALATDAELRRRMGAAARARAASEFTEAAFSDRFLRAIGLRHADPNLDAAERIG